MESELHASAVLGRLSSGCPPITAGKHNAFSDLVKAGCMTPSLDSHKI